MTRATLCTRTLGLFALMVLPLCTGPAFAQVTPAAGYTPPDDTPSFKVGTVIYADYTYQEEPTTIDADGNTIGAEYRCCDLRRSQTVLDGLDDRFRTKQGNAGMRRSLDVE